MLRMISTMSIIRGLLPRMIKNEKGAMAIEYALIVSFVALVIIAGVTLLGTNLNTWFSNMGRTVGVWASSAASAS